MSNREYIVIEPRYILKVQSFVGGNVRNITKNTCIEKMYDKPIPYLNNESFKGD